jgi:hypothetical protein
MTSSSRLRRVSYSVLVLLGVMSPALANPRITDVSLRGLQVGGTTTLTVRGAALMPGPRLLLGIPARQEVVGKPAAGAVTFKVTLGADVIPGLANLRLTTEKGISESVLIGLDRLEQRAIAEKTATLPAALSGSVTGSTVVRTSFMGKAGQELIAEVEAQRLGSKLRPVLHLYDAGRRQLTWALPSLSLAGDARLRATLPADGLYSVEIHDLQYSGPGPGHFRLKLGSFQYADLVFPPAVQRGKQTAVEMIGNGPPGQRVEVTGTGEGASQPVPWPGVSLATGPRPHVLVSDITEVVEVAAMGSPQLLPVVPVAVSGRLDAPGQEDVYRVPVAEGARLRFEVFADRLGSPIDAALEVRDNKGRRLAQSDDQPGTTDPRVDFTVPRGLKELQVSLSDQVGRGDRRSIYRLVITALDGKPQGRGFRLRVTGDSFTVPQGATQILEVFAERNGYDGPIKLLFDRLPEGVTASSTEIPAGADGTLIALTGTGKGSEPLVTTLRGSSIGVQPAMSAVAGVENHPLATLQPWLSQELAVSLSGSAGFGFAIDWRGLAPESKLTLAQKLSIPIKLSRPQGLVGGVKLTLVSGQPVPLLNNRPDPNRSIRTEQANVLIPIDPKAKAAADALAAAEKALDAARKQAKPNPAAIKAAATRVAEARKALQAAEAGQKTTFDFNILIPAALDAPSCDLAVRAELLAADNRTVLTEAYTPVRRFAVLNPLGIKLTGGPVYEATLDVKQGATINLAGSIERRAGFAGDVTLTVTGQPAGVAAPRVVVKAGQTAFTLPLKFPANFAAGMIETVKVTASGPPDPKRPQVVVKAEMPVTLKLLPGGP